MGGPEDLVRQIGREAWKVWFARAEGSSSQKAWLARSDRGQKVRFAGSEGIEWNAGLPARPHDTDAEVDTARITAMHGPGS